MRKKEGRLLAIPDGLDMRAASLAEPLAVALHGVTRSNARAGQRVLVTGAGPIGALTVVALQARGVDDVTVSEPHPLRRALAELLGAKVLTPDTLGALAGSSDGRFDVVIETSGSPQAAQTAIDRLVTGGTLVLVGVIAKPANLDVLRILTDELVVTGSALYDAGGISEALSLLAAGQVPVDVLNERATNWRRANWRAKSW
jgi:2-desacetyl-2-hydroxyethyl bacteriochlorophyllide A dehydrogenase